MSTAIFLGAFLLPLVISQDGGILCQRRLDVISVTAWRALQTSYYGCHLQDDVELVAVGVTGGTTHAVLHGMNTTFLRGNSNNFHLYGEDMTREIEEIRGFQVKDVGFGFRFIAILTHDGEVWTVGVNNFGQLGHHETRNRPVFSRVEGLPPVKQLAVGSYHCVVLTKDGQLFSWGYNANKQLGRPTNNTANPTPENFTLGQGVSLPQSVCCGWDQCAALVEDSMVYTWGNSDRIGRPSGDGLPEVVQGLPANQNITKVSCGVFHTLALVESGDLYGWGYNGYGEQLDVLSNAPHAARLDVGERIVRDVVAGYYISIIRTYSSLGEYFGRYNGYDIRRPQLASGTEYTRDVMARSVYGQETRGAVHVRCQANDMDSCRNYRTGGME